MINEKNDHSYRNSVIALLIVGIGILLFMWAMGFKAGGNGERVQPDFFGFLYPNATPVPTETPYPEKYKTLKVTRLYEQKSGNSTSGYWMVSQEPVAYGMEVKAWLVLEVGKCYQFHFYLHGEYIDQAKQVYCEGL